MSAIWFESENDWRSSELAQDTTYRVFSAVVPGGNLASSSAVVPGGKPASSRAVVPGGNPASSASRRPSVERCSRPEPGDVILHHAAPGWVLVGPPAVCRINGERVATGMKRLEHKDEIVIGASQTTLLYSSEAIATITAHVSGSDPAVCPRCRLPIDDGAPVVACPSCRVAHHQDETNALPCWTYSDKCAICGHSTALNTGYTWPPEGW
jgi:hypothetical protein